MTHQESKESFSYHSQKQEELLEKYQTLQANYQKLKIKYEKLKRKFDYDSEKEDTKSTEQGSTTKQNQKQNNSTEVRPKLGGFEQKSQLKKQYSRENLEKDANDSEQFSWHQSQQEVTKTQPQVMNYHHKQISNSTKNKLIQHSIDSQNFCFNQQGQYSSFNESFLKKTAVHNIAKSQESKKCGTAPQCFKQNMRSDISSKRQNIGLNKSVSNNSQNFQFSGYKQIIKEPKNQYKLQSNLNNSQNFDYHDVGQKIIEQEAKEKNLDKDEFGQKVLQNKDFSANEQNFSFHQSVDKINCDNSDNLSNFDFNQNETKTLKEKSEVSHNDSNDLIFGENKFDQGQNKSKADSSNFMYSIKNRTIQNENSLHNDSNNFSLQISAVLPHNFLSNQVKNQAQRIGFGNGKTDLQTKGDLVIKKQGQQQREVKENHKNQNTIKNQIVSGSQCQSFSNSNDPNLNNFKYQIKQRSFNLPQQINDPIQIEDVELIPSKVKKAKTRQQKGSKKISPNKLAQINEAFDDSYESEEQELIYLTKLINKLNLRKKISINQLKIISKETKRIAEEHQQLSQIYQTGAYELDFINKGAIFDISVQYIQKIKKWNRLLVTQISVSNEKSYEQVQMLFKEIEWPSLRQVTIYLDDLVFQDDQSMYKQTDQEFSLDFLKYYGYSKKLRALSLKGDSCNEEIAKSLVDLDFPHLKTLYLGFNETLADEVVNILLCNNLKNLPKCQIYIATWQGQIDERFKKFYNRVQFLTLDSDQQEW